MRIAFLSSEYPTEQNFAGGLGSYLRRVGLSLIEYGHEVEIFTLSHVNETISDGPIRVNRVARGEKTIEKISKMAYLWRYSGYINVLVPSLKLALGFRKRHKETHFDIVQASNYLACGIVSALIKKVPFVTRVSSYEPLWRDAYKKSLDSHQMQIEKAEIFQLRLSSAVYAPSKILSEVLNKKEKLHVRVIEPPFDLTKVKKNSLFVQQSPISGDYALFFGSIGLMKGCDRLVRVLPGLLRRNPDMRFVFVGKIFAADNGMRFDKFINMKLAKFSEQIFVLGAQEHSFLLSLVQKARFVVLPSKIDNLPNTCMEAMALERIVVGTHNASFDQLIQDGVNGFLVSQNNDSELCSCMDRVWNMDSTERKRIGKNACKTMERMDPHRAAKRLTAFFEEVIAQKR